MRHIIPDDYPQSLSLDELIKAIEEYALKATSASNDHNYSLGPNYWKEISELGQNELAIRIQRDLVTEINKLSTEITALKTNNRKSNIQTKILTIVTILLAGFTLIFGYKSMNLSKADQFSDDNWQKEQIELLKNKNTLSKEIIMKMDSINNSINSEVMVTKRNEN